MRSEFIFCSTFLIIICSLPNLKGYSSFNLPFTEEEQVQKLLTKAADLKKIDPNESIRLLDSCRSLTKQLKNPVLDQELAFNYCTIELTSGLLEIINDNCHQAFKYYSEEEIVQNKGIIANQLGIYYDVIGKKDSSIFFFEQAEKIFQELKDYYWLGELYNNWGVVYSGSFDQNQSINLYLQGLHYSNQSNNTRSIIASNINLGRAYFRQGFNDLSASHVLRAHEIAKNNQWPFWQSVSLAFLGDIYFKKKEYDEALKAFQKGMEISENAQNEYALVMLLNLTGKLYLETEQCDKGLDYFIQAIHKAKLIRKEKGMMPIYNNIVQAYLKLGNKVAAKEYLQKAQTYLKSSPNNRQKIEHLRLWADYYLMNGEMANAYTKLFQHSQLNELFANQKNAGLISKIEASHKEKAQKDQINQLTKKNNSQKIYLLIFSILVALSFGFLLTIFELYQDNKKLNATLESRILERTIELERSNKDLQQFAYVASHDLKTPLRSITSFLGLIKKKMIPYGNHQLDELLSFAMTGAKQMNTLIDDLLAYSKINQPNLRLESVDLNHLLDQVSTHLKSESKKSIELSWTQLPVVIGNSTQLFQLFQNLIANGIKYNESAVPVIKVSCKRLSDHWLFVIQDNGIGIEEKYQRVIFEMFRRLHNRDEYEGTGVGLALCKRVVEIHNGKIWLKSQLGKGATFSFTISNSLLPTDEIEYVVESQPPQIHYHQ